VDLVQKITRLFRMCVTQAEACRSVEQAFRRCPNGMYAEIKYDGERVQLHKKGASFKYFSRSLKPVQQHKVPLFIVMLTAIILIHLYNTVQNTNL